MIVIKNWFQMNISDQFKIRIFSIAYKKKWPLM